MKNAGMLFLAAAGLGGLLIFGRKGPAKASTKGLWPGEPEPYPSAKDPLDNVCDPADTFEKPGVQVFRRVVLERFGGYDAGIVRSCSVGGPSEHHEGRAWDWGVLAYQGKPAAHVVAGLDAMLANDAEVLRRAGVDYFIYNRRQWRAYPPRGYSPYTKPGGSPHIDHVHFSFTRAGADGLTSWYQNPVIP